MIGFEIRIILSGKAMLTNVSGGDCSRGCVNEPCELSLLTMQPLKLHTVDSPSVVTLEKDHLTRYMPPCSNRLDRWIFYMMKYF